jgi:hypothetical protein
VERGFPVEKRAARDLPHGRSRYRHHGCRCEVCIEANRLYMRELRARKRRLRPVPVANATKAVADVRQDVAPVANATPGPSVAAVQRELEALRLWDLPEYGAECAVAIAMARILDHPNLATTQGPPRCVGMGLRPGVMRLVGDQPGPASV